MSYFTSSRPSILKGQKLEVNLKMCFLYFTISKNSNIKETVQNDEIIQGLFMHKISSRNITKIKSYCDKVIFNIFHSAEVYGSHV